MRCPKDSEFVCSEGWDEKLYREALNWVDETRRVAFISEQERKSEDPRVQIHHLESPLQMEKLIRQIAWSAVQKKLTVFGSPDFQQKIEECHLAAHLLLSEAADFWVKIWQNGQANQKPFRSGLELKGVFSGVPALIVGAGPSLEKNRHLLSQFEKKALIFAGGSALNAIGVEPHFAASIDAQAPYRQFKMQPFWQTPFCYQARMNPENFSLLHAESLLFPDSSSEALNWLYGQEPFESGWTVGTFLAAIAVHFGCSPLIFVGMDFCYSEHRKYAQIDAECAENLMQIGDHWTQPDWLMAAKWIENLQKKAICINATEGGILQIPSQPLQAILEKCTELGDLRQRVHEAIQKLPLRTCEGRFEEWNRSSLRLLEGSSHFEEEIVYQKLLAPLWQIWRPIFEREIEVNPQQKIELHRISFFQRVLEEHGQFILP